jgi:hypothetical protein
MMAAIFHGSAASAPAPFGQAHTHLGSRADRQGDPHKCCWAFAPPDVDCGHLRKKERRMTNDRLGDKDSKRAA